MYVCTLAAALDTSSNLAIAPGQGEAAPRRAAGHARGGDAAKEAAARGPEEGTRRGRTMIAARRRSEDE